MIVIADGGGDAVVARNLTEAVQALFGVEAHKIKIMKRGWYIKRRLVKWNEYLRKSDYHSCVGGDDRSGGIFELFRKIFHEKDGGAEEANADLANQELLDISEEDIETVGDEIASNDSDVEGTPGEAVLTNGSAETTVAQAKVTREQVRAQNKETLQAIIDNTNLSESEKQEAVSQLVQMTQIAEQEAAVETMMASKGFSEAVVSIDADSADIVVKAEELTDANRAQIEDIVTRKTKIAPQNIVITPIRE